MSKENCRDGQTDWRTVSRAIGLTISGRFDFKRAQVRFGDGKLAMIDVLPTVHEDEAGKVETMLRPIDPGIQQRLTKAYIDNKV